MPVVYKSDLKRFAPSQKLPKELGRSPKVYHYKEHQTVDEVVGDGIFSNISNLIQPAVKLVSNNKDLIANAAKGAAAVGGLAATISQIQKSNKELEQLKEIRKLRESVQKDAEALGKAGTKISEDAKKKIHVASLGPSASVLKKVMVL